jgi:hypothetical protein
MHLGLRLCGTRSLSMNVRRGLDALVALRKSALVSDCDRDGSDFIYSLIDHSVILVSI